MPTALVIAPDGDEKKEVTASLVKAGFAASAAEYDDAFEFLDGEEKVDLVAVGASAGLKNPVEVAENLRKKGGPYLQVTFMVQNASDEEKASLLKAGADDVLEAGDTVTLEALAGARIRVIEECSRLSKEVEKTKEEMAMARKVQEKLLPQKFPETEKIRFAARYQPTESVGGDFYDIISHEDDTYGLFISDVSGHGIHAAFTTMSIKTALNTWARGIVSPSETFILVNNLVLGIVDIGRFVTAFYGKIDMDLMEFTYSNAGHPPALLFRAGKKEPEFLDTDSGFPLGISAESVYQEKTVSLGKGDKLFVYTDGVDEARNPKSELYGEERFFKTIADNLEKDVDSILDAVLEDVTRFADGVPFFDDINLLAFEVL